MSFMQNCWTSPSGEGDGLKMEIISTPSVVELNANLCLSVKYIQLSSWGVPMSQSDRDRALGLRFCQMKWLSLRLRWTPFYLKCLLSSCVWRLKLITNTSLLNMICFGVFFADWAHKSLIFIHQQSQFIIFNQTKKWKKCMCSIYC